MDPASITLHENQKRRNVFMDFLPKLFYFATPNRVGIHLWLNINIPIHSHLSLKTFYWLWLQDIWVYLKCNSLGEIAHIFTNIVYMCLYIEIHFEIRLPPYILCLHNLVTFSIYKSWDYQGHHTLLIYYFRNIWWYQTILTNRGQSGAAKWKSCSFRLTFVLITFVAFSGKWSIFSRTVTKKGHVNLIHDWKC